MWPRHLELALALWLLVSPFVFGHGPDDVLWWATDLSCGVLVLGLALLSHWPRTRRAHLLELAPIAWLVAAGWVRSPAPAAQNQLAVGLLLVLFVILPTESSSPPRGWQAAGARVP